MKKTAKGMFRTLATRSVIAAIPVAMISAYAGNLLVPTPPRMAALDYQQVAEITVSPNTVGIAASPLYGQTKAQIDQQLNEMQALGVQNIRVFVPWASIDFFGPSQPGSLSWSTLDLVMQSAKEHNMGVMAEINSTPPYAVTNGGFGSGTPDTADFAAFMTKFVTAYGPEVSAYEIWNEPNSIQFSNPIDPAAYAALVKAAYQAIKPLDPTATVVAGAVGHVFTTGVTMDPVDFVKAMIAADPTIGQYFDALSYHPYDETLPFSQGNVDPNSGLFASDTAYNQLKDLVALFPTKKVWLSEFGVPTYTYTDGNGVIHTITQTQQEQYIADLINSWGTSFGQNAGPIFLYTGRDTATGDGVADDNYGLWTTLGQPKEVITAFLAQWYKDHPQNTTGPTGGGGTPTDPAAALAAAFQVLAQQIAQAISQAISQAFAQQLGQQIATALVNAIANALAGLGQPQPAAAATPLTLRVASVVAPETASVTETSAGVSDPSAAAGEVKVASAKAAAPADAAPADAPSAEPAVTTPVASTAVVTTPVASTSVVTTPVASTPVVTTPVTSTPVVTTAVASTPEPASGTTAGSSTAGASKADTAGPSQASSAPAGQGSAPKAGDAYKSASKAGGDKAGTSTSDSTTRHGKSKEDNDVTSADPKPKTEAAGSAASSASSSTSTGSASTG